MLQQRRTSLPHPAPPGLVSTQFVGAAPFLPSAGRRVVWRSRDGRLHQALGGDPQGWLSEDDFQQGVALCQAVPGATAMQCAAYVGLRVRGLRGAVLAYVGFGLPASS